MIAGIKKKYAGMYRVSIVGIGISLYICKENKGWVVKTIDPTFYKFKGKTKRECEIFCRNNY